MQGREGTLLDGQEVAARPRWISKARVEWMSPGYETHTSTFFFQMNPTLNQMVAFALQLLALFKIPFCEGI